MSDATHDGRETLRLAGTTPVAAASAGARERARRAFLEGRDEPRPRLRIRHVLVPLAAAASAILALWLAARPVGSWVVLESAGARGDLGVALPVGTRFDQGALVASGTGNTEVQLGEALKIQASPGTQLELPPGPGRWIGHTRHLRVDAGEIFATTGGRPLGFELVVESPEARTRIVGTTFAVRCNELGTCVCLWEGRIESEAADGRYTVDVPVGKRVQFFRDGREPMTAPLSDDERARLGALREAGLAGAN